MFHHLHFMRYCCTVLSQHIHELGNKYIDSNVIRGHNLEKLSAVFNSVTVMSESWVTGLTHANYIEIHSGWLKTLWRALTSQHFDGELVLLNEKQHHLLYADRTVSSNEPSVEYWVLSSNCVTHALVSTRVWNLRFPESCRILRILVCEEPKNYIQRL